MNRKFPARSAGETAPAAPPEGKPDPAAAEERRSETDIPARWESFGYAAGRVKPKPQEESLLQPPENL